MSDKSTILRDRQLAVRREMDRRRISLKVASFDSGLPYSTLLSYFPGERDKTSATISGASLFALCGAIPEDLLSLLLPDGFQIVRAPESINHDALCELAQDYIHSKAAAHREDSECGVEIGPKESTELVEKAVRMRT